MCRTVWHKTHPKTHPQTPNQSKPNPSQNPKGDNPKKPKTHPKTPKTQNPKPALRQIRTDVNLFCTFSGSQIRQEVSICQSKRCQLIYFLELSVEVFVSPVDRSFLSHVYRRPVESFEKPENTILKKETKKEIEDVKAVSCQQYSSHLHRISPSFKEQLMKKGEEVLWLCNQKSFALGPPVQNITKWMILCTRNLRTEKYWSLRKSVPVPFTVVQDT